MKKSSKRKNSIRRPNWDYRTPGYYFITLCTDNRSYYFEDQEIKQIVEEYVTRLPTLKSCRHISLDCWVIMPNHIHLLIFLGKTLEYKTIPYKYDRAMARSVGATVSVLKRNASRKIKRNGFEEKFWQRGYYDRIVRNEDELNHVREYIRLNPIRWAEDHENLDRLLEKMVYHA